MSELQFSLCNFLIGAIGPFAYCWRRSSEGGLGCGRWVRCSSRFCLRGNRGLCIFRILSVQHLCSICLPSIICCILCSWKVSQMVSWVSWLFLKFVKINQIVKSIKRRNKRAGILIAWTHIRLRLYWRMYSLTHPYQVPVRMKTVLI